ncbi:MAG: hypothetical protein ACKVQU_04600, partial [Burkholderiales bacterium]
SSTRYFPTALAANGPQLNNLAPHAGAPYRHGEHKMPFVFPFHSSLFTVVVLLVEFRSRAL